MADSILRKDAFLKRIKGGPGGHCVHWSPSDVHRIAKHFGLVERDIQPALSALPTRKEAFLRSTSILGDASYDFTATLSTAALDRSGDTIAVPGWKLNEYRNDPVVFFNHLTSELPIGRSPSVWIAGSKLKATIKLAPESANPVSEQVRQLVNGRYLSAVSVGFVPTKWEFARDSSRPNGINFLEQTLLEFSIVGIPANPEATIDPVVSGGKSAGRSSRNVPPDDVPADDANDWQCCGGDTMPVDASDDAYDSIAVKAALLAKFSPAGTILEEARDYFFAVDTSAPYDASSYLFPFCRVAGGCIIASKIGWRQSFAALEKSNMPGNVIGDARALVDRLELRLGDVKTVARRREASALIAKARAICESIPDDPVPTTPAQRLSEARNFRRVVEGTK